MTASRDRGQAQALAVLVAGAAIIGLAPILVRLADAGPAAVGFWRVAFAMPLLGLMALRTDGGSDAPTASPCWRAWPSPATSASGTTASTSPRWPTPRC